MIGPHPHFKVRMTSDYGTDVEPVAYPRRHGVTVRATVRASLSGV